MTSFTNRCRFFNASLSRLANRVSRGSVDARVSSVGAQTRSLRVGRGVRFVNERVSFTQDRSSIVENQRHPVQFRVLEIEIRRYVSRARTYDVDGRFHARTRRRSVRMVFVDVRRVPSGHHARRRVSVFRSARVWRIVRRHGLRAFGELLVVFAERSSSFSRVEISNERTLSKQSDVVAQGTSFLERNLRRDHGTRVEQRESIQTQRPTWIHRSFQKRVVHDGSTNARRGRETIQISRANAALHQLLQTARRRYDT